MKSEKKTVSVCSLTERAHNRETRFDVVFIKVEVGLYDQQETLKGGISGCVHEVDEIADSSPFKNWVQGKGRNRGSTAQTHRLVASMLPVSSATRALMRATRDSIAVAKSVLALTRL